MNKERILALADLIEQQPHTSLGAKEGFNLSTYVHTCGTPACIAGWAAWEALDRPQTMRKYTIGDIVRLAKTYLGLSKDQEELFCGSSLPAPLYEVTPREVAQGLREFVETGILPSFCTIHKVD